MFVELRSLDFGCVRRLFLGHKQYVPVLAVIEGSYPGRVFVDDPDNPAMAVVWAIGRWGYIESERDCLDLDSSLADLITRTIIPDSLKLKSNWFELYARNSPAWIKILDQSLRDFECRRHHESVYTWDESAYRQFRSHYSTPDEVVLEISDIPVLSEQIGESPFVSQDFKLQTAIGCKAKVNGDVVALCRSNGFAAAAEFMIDVVTHDSNLRGRGYATAASVGLLDYCLAKDLTPLWETTESNMASQRLARTLGFVEQETYPVFAVRF